MSIAEVRTTQQGQVYFYHVKTGVSTWHDPRIPRDFSPTVSPDSLGPLPSGWEMRQTTSGRVSNIYFLTSNSLIYTCNMYVCLNLDFRFISSITITEQLSLLTLD